MAAFDEWLTRRSFERRTRELVTPRYRAPRALTGSAADAGGSPPKCIGFTAAYCRFTS